MKNTTQNHVMQAQIDILKNALAAVHQEATQQQADLRDYASTLLVVIRYYDVSGQWNCMSYSVAKVEQLTFLLFKWIYCNNT